MIEFLVWFVACFISTFGFTYLFYKLADCKKVTKFSLIIFIIGILIITIIKYYDLKLLSLISYFLFYPVLFYELNNSSIKNVIFYLIVIWLYAIIFDFLSMIFILLLNYLFVIDINSNLYIILPSFFVTIMLILISKLGFIHKITNYLYKSFINIETIDFLLLIHVSFIFVTGLSIAINIDHLKVGFLVIIIVFISTLFLILFIKNKFDKYENQIFLETLKSNNDFYISMDAENHIFKHNLIAKLLSVKSVSNKKARSLIDEMLFEFSSNIDFSKHIQNIPYGINGIIYQELYNYLNEINVKIDTKINFDVFDVLRPKRYNVFVEKLVIMLDNAIESCLKSAEKLLIIDFYSINDSLFIEIKNTFSSSLNLDEIGNKNYSTKSKKRGFGLFSILREKEASVNVKIINNFFVAKLEAKFDKFIKKTTF